MKEGLIDLKKNIFEKKELIEKKLEELNKKDDDFLEKSYKKRFEILAELNKIKSRVIIDNNYLQLTTWIYELTNWNDELVFKSTSVPEIFNLLDKKEHGDVRLNEFSYLTVDEDILTLVFQNVKAGIKYISEWDLKINMKNLDDGINKLQTKLDKLIVVQKSL